MAKAAKTGKLFLNKEVSLQDLTKGIEFEVDCDDYFSDSEEETYFNDEAFDSFKNDVANMDSELKPKLLGGTDLPFALLRERMEPITEDRKVLKEVMKCGAGIMIPDKSVVMMHYDAYFENQKQPFDSTRLRKNPYKFLLGNGSVLPALEIAIKTMKKDEMSRFIVHPDYAYGEMGCPPRIPPSAEILYEVEVLNFYKSKDAIEYEDMTPEDQKKAPFEKITAVYNCEQRMANDLFHSKLYKPAIARYRKMVNILENVSVADEEEDEKRKSYLLKLYLNLAQCYINIESPQKAIVYSDLALKIDNNSVKALFRMGHALYLAEEYERGEYFLNRAKQFNPYDKAINGVIAKLESKRKQHLDWEKMFYGKMFSSGSDVQKDKDLPESQEFISACEEQLEAFVKSEEKELTFSSGYTENQLEVVKELAKKLNLAFVSKIVCDRKINKVVKRQ